MSELKDPAIKLFGKTIPLQEISPQRVDEENGQDMDPSFSESSVLDKEDKETDKDITRDTTNESNQDGLPPATSEESSNPEATSGISDSTKTSSVEKENNGSKNSKTEEEQHDTSTSQEKMLKKPDKVLPCPRCNSMDTKFCYYNNYNVNQPRHFCKNCQRYWTAGGTMRNVPVGAGRRKNKNSASQYRHITVSEALQGVRADIPNGVHHPALKTNGTVLTFGSDMPLHESMASVLNLADKTMRNCTRNGFHKPEAVRIPVSYGSIENCVSHSNGSTVTMSNTKDGSGKNGSDEQVMQNCQRFPPQIPCFPGGPWPSPWSSAQWSSPVPQPTFCPPGYPMPFYPAPPYWGCTMPGAWNYPWLPQPSSPNQSSTCSGPNSPTLGKHSRDENTLKTSNSGEDDTAKENTGEKSLWIPKTLRIDDPGEAAKSSIWTTLGIKNEMPDAIGGRGLFKAFQSKTDEKKHATETSSVLQANPAALSRSVQFHESS